MPSRLIYYISVVGLSACAHRAAPPPKPTPVSISAPVARPTPVLVTPSTTATYADPSTSSRSVTVVARLIGPIETHPLCGRIFAATRMDYEVIKVEAGTLTGTRLIAAVPCVDMPRPSYDRAAGTLDAFRAGDKHRLVLSTDEADSRGMSQPVAPPAYFMVVRADPA